MKIHYVFGAMVAAVMAATNASATTLDFTIAGQDSFSWTMDSNPTPYSYNDGSTHINVQNFTVNPGPSAISVGSFAIDFYSSSSGSGGLSGAGNAYINTSEDGLYGAQIFSGLVDAPTFSPGIFALAECPCGGARDVDTLTVSPVPLPGALPLFGSAIIGIGAFARRRAKKGANAA